MHILVLIFMFVVMAIGAACKGDYSGIAVIGKVVGGCVLLFVIGWLMLNASFIVIPVTIIIIIVIFIICFKGK